MLFKIKIPLYNIPKYAPHINFFHIAYKNNNGEIKSSSTITIAEAVPFNKNPKKAISLSGDVTNTAIDIAAHKNKTIDRIFKDNGNDFQPFI